jgi:DNA-binding NarL/FixJ family response regulator
VRILIADDEAAIPRLIEIYLHQYIDEFEVLVASDGKRAVDLVKSIYDSGTRDAVPEVNILDMRMPEMNGLEAAKALVTLGAKNVFIMTAYLDPELVKAASIVGATGILKKSEGFKSIAKKIADIANHLQPAL